MENNGVTVPVMTVLNEISSNENKDASNKTDAEQLLEILKQQKNITYFAMYAESGSTPLLTIPMSRRATKETQKLT